MAENYLDATRQALAAAAAKVRDNLARRSPGEKSAKSWRVTNLQDRVRIRSGDIGGYMTDTDGRHPVFARGDRRKWTWVNENVHQPQQTGWAERAVDEVADDAGNEFLDNYLSVIARHSDYFRVGR